MLGDGIVAKGGVQVMAHEVGAAPALREHDALELTVVVLGRRGAAVASPVAGLTQFPDRVHLKIGEWICIYLACTGLWMDGGGSWNRGIDEGISQSRDQSTSGC